MGLSGPAEDRIMAHMTTPTLSKRSTKLADAVTAIARPALEPDESVSIAVGVMPKGAVGGIAAGSVGGAVGVIASSKILRSSEKEIEPTGLPSDPQQVIGLTARALLFFSRSRVTGRPKELRSSLPLEEIAAIRHEGARMGDRLHLTLRSGAEVSYTCVKVDPGAAFAEAVTACLTAKP